MQVIVGFGVDTKFPVLEEVAYSTISSACGLNEPVLRRILRHAITKHIYREPCTYFVVHTATSRLLVEDPQLRERVNFSTKEKWQASSQTVNALMRYPEP